MPPVEPDPDAVRALAQELQRTGKYTTLSDDVLERTAAWALARHRARKEATKAARRKLHQVHAAFVTDRALARAERLIGELDGATDPAAVAATCRAVLGCHASTAEREPFVEDFYAAAFEGMPPPARVVDVAAGLNPFAIPWMGLPAGAEYEASDIDHRFAALARSLAPSLDVDLSYAVGDLVTDGSAIRADAVLVLKTITTLEQEERGSARRLLARIDAPRVVVSFSARSLGGRGKGMPETYERTLDELLEGLPWRRSQRVDFPTETLYILGR